MHLVAARCYVKFAFRKVYNNNCFGSAVTCQAKESHAPAPVPLLERLACNGVEGGGGGKYLLAPAALVQFYPAPARVSVPTAKVLVHFCIRIYCTLYRYQCTKGTLLPSCLRRIPTTAPALIY
jgi:hypothetical protein